MRPIIRAAWLLLGAAAIVTGGSSCALNELSGTPPAAASAPRIEISVIPAPSAGADAGTGAVWVLTPLGLNVRSQPATSADRVTTLSQGTRLDVLTTQAVGTATWLQVKNQSGTIQGWVLDDPLLVGHREMSLHLDSARWSILFPATWSYQQGNPAAFNAPASEGGDLLVQTGATPDGLLKVPTVTGSELKQESPVEVYGVTTFITDYQLNGGGFEYEVRLRWSDHLAFLFLFQSGRQASPDSTLFRTMLASVIITAPPASPAPR